MPDSDYDLTRGWTAARTSKRNQCPITHSSLPAANVCQHEPPMVAASSSAKKQATSVASPPPQPQTTIKPIITYGRRTTVGTSYASAVKSTPQAPPPPQSLAAAPAQTSTISRQVDAAGPIANAKSRPPRSTTSSVPAAPPATLALHMTQKLRTSFLQSAKEDLDVDKALRKQQAIDLMRSCHSPVEPSVQPILPVSPVASHISTRSRFETLHPGDLHANELHRYYNVAPHDDVDEDIRMDEQGTGGPFRMILIRIGTVILRMSSTPGCSTSRLRLLPGVNAKTMTAPSPLLRTPSQRGARSMSTCLTTHSRGSHRRGPRSSVSFVNFVPGTLLWCRIHRQSWPSSTRRALLRRWTPGNVTRLTAATTAPGRPRNLAQSIAHTPMRATALITVAHGISSASVADAPMMRTATMIPQRPKTVVGSLHLVPKPPALTPSHCHLSCHSTPRVNIKAISSTMPITMGSGPLSPTTRAAEALRQAGNNLVSSSATLTPRLSPATMTFPLPSMQNLRCLHRLVPRLRFCHMMPRNRPAPWLPRPTQALLILRLNVAGVLPRLTPLGVWSPATSTQIRPMGSTPSATGRTTMPTPPPSSGSKIRIQPKCPACKAGCFPLAGI